MATKPTLNPADVSLLISAMKVVFATKDDVHEIETIKESIRHLPTKEEFFSRMDKLSGEYKKIDEAETMHAGTISDHTDTLEKQEERIKALENRLKTSPTAVAV